MILRHITPGRNLSKILLEGLIPCAERGLCALKYKDNVIWLTDNVQYILEEQAGESWILREKPIELMIQCNGLNIIKVDNIYEHEFQHLGPIDKSRIVGYKSCTLDNI